MFAIIVNRKSPAYHSAVGSQSTGMRRASTYGCEDFISRRRPQTSPAHRNAVGAQPAGIILTSAYGCEGFISRRRCLPIAVIPPAYRSAVLSQPTSMIPAVGYGCEGFISRRRCLPIAVIPPAYRNSVRAKSANMIPGVAPTEAYRRKSFTTRRIHSVLVLFIRNRPSTPAHHSAILRSNAATQMPPRGYSAECHCAGCACGCRRVVDGLLRACVVRVR